MLRVIFELTRPVRTEFLDAIYDLSEGNPFFIEEVLKSLVATGDIFYVEGRWDRKALEELRIPRSVQDAVRRRLEGLGLEAGRLVTLAAVAGRRFEFSLLQVLTQHDEAELLGLIKELIATQLVVEESAERFAFRHALTREAIRTTLLARERRALHWSIAEVLQHLQPQEAHLSDLAYHFFEAEVWDKAFAYARRAGERALSLHAPRTAAEQLSRAFLSASRLNRPAPLELYYARGLALETLGEFEGARGDFEAALALAQTAEDHQGAWRALLDLGRLWASRDYAQTGLYFEHALKLARHVDDPAILAPSLNRLGNWFANTGRTADGIRLHLEALATLRAQGAQQGTAETLDLLGVAYGLHGDPLSVCCS